eukprot:10047845-Lingulodinium_polyedra.AAC.1
MGSTRRLQRREAPRQRIWRWRWTTAAPRCAQIARRRGIRGRLEASHSAARCILRCPGQRA